MSREKLSLSNSGVPDQGLILPFEVKFSVLGIDYIKQLLWRPFFKTHIYIFTNLHKQELSHILKQVISAFLQRKLAYSIPQLLFSTPVVY